MQAKVRSKVEDAAATIEEKKDVVKAEAEEKVDKLRANDEASKEEAAQEKTEKLRNAEETKNRKLHHERHDPIGDRPTPADLDMPAENPSQPAMSSNSGMVAAPVPGALTATGGLLIDKHDNLEKPL
ncbi:hypothetical protein R1flu_005997 [Riccia fluitans]|uniref:Late embryogenesis abundant protein n=1 Tax=Riccia fluitans TaxID=41844 RepID=A0ABD1YUT8_9MARC